MTPDRARELLDYDPATGVFVWRVDRTGPAKAGTIAGRRDGGGYVQISVDGKRYRANRLAWFMQTGAWPASEIDHINGIRTDDRFSNLREVSRAENMKNKRPYKGKQYPGVVLLRGKWMARIQDDYIGVFPTLDAAVNARAAAEAARGFHPNHGRA
jgi:hypothetical protein